MSALSLLAILAQWIALYAVWFAVASESGEITATVVFCMILWIGHLHFRSHQ